MYGYWGNLGMIVLFFFIKVVNFQVNVVNNEVVVC